MKYSIVQTVGYAGQVLEQTGLRELVFCEESGGRV